MKTLFIIAFLVVGTVAVAVAANVGLDRNAREECYHWQNDAKTLTQFYLTEAQAEQCAFYKIEVDAPVRG